MCLGKYNPYNRAAIHHSTSVSLVPFKVLLTLVICLSVVLEGWLAYLLEMYQKQEIQKIKSSVGLQNWKEAVLLFIPVQYGKYLAILCVSAFLTYFLKLKLVWAKCMPWCHRNLESIWPRVLCKIACFVKSVSLCSTAFHLSLCIFLLPLVFPRFLLWVCLFNNPLRPPATLHTSPSLRYLTSALLKHSLQFQWGKNFSSTAKDTPQIILCFCDVFYKQCMG